MKHFSHRTLHEGTINASLRWHFKLTDLKFVVLWFDGKGLAGAHSSRHRVQPPFENQFGMDWILNESFVRLIIFNLTIKENATFTCRVLVLKAHLTFTFYSIVQVDVGGKLKVKSRNICIEGGGREKEDITCFVSGNIMVFHQCLYDK